MIARSTFRAPRGLVKRNLQTLLASSLLRRRVAVARHRETVELPDGDFVHLDWAERHHEDASSPLLLVLHGLEGSIRSRYAAAVMQAAGQAGFAAGLLNARGCSGVHNRKAASYHAGLTTDLAFVLDRLKARWPGRAVVAVGYSLGGNALLKFLGEAGEDAPLRAAVAVSVPFDLVDSARAIDSGFARFYQWVLMRRMRASVERKLGHHDMPVTAEELPALRSFFDFDERVTAPLHGFASALDYYRASSCAGYLRSIAVPTLILHARDDPFMTPACIPDETMLSPQVTLEVSDHGGHVGFLENRVPFALRSWLEARIVPHLQQVLGAQATAAQGQSARP
ncbi:MAG: hydrolase [Pseudomonadota bacterium]